MDDTQFQSLLDKLDEIEHNTHGSKDAGYNTEQLGDRLDRIIELLELLVKTKKTGH